MTVASRKFDPHWTTRHTPLKNYLRTLSDDIASGEGRTRARSSSVQENFERAVEAIMLDLFRAHAAYPKIVVGIGTNRNALQAASRSIYGTPLLAPRVFEPALEGLLNAGAVHQTHQHWHEPGGKENRTARYRVSETAITALRRAGACPAVLRRCPRSQTILLRNRQKDLVEYEDCEFTGLARERLAVINGRLSQHWYDLALPDARLARHLSAVRERREDEATHPFDFSARQLYRVFNNGSWQQGGRFYGGWWTGAPRELRPYIEIDGKRTVEVDYSGLHAAMLYAEAGLETPDDPYARCVTYSGSAQERDLVKRTFVALLNANNGNRAREFADFKNIITTRSWKQYKSFIVASFPELSSNFGTGVGCRLQHPDSQLAEAVMLDFAQRGYPCLPVHDSFIVHQGLEDQLVAAMRDAFKARFGINITVKVRHGILYQPEMSDSLQPLDDNIEDILYSLEGYEARLQGWWELGHA
ncbi:hypothetical protein [Acuticoccus sediminis]|uniref:hypothetical protein n=1 Tax=Acuticoccus sediminis TaxID=2184697 RepID=UPI001CFF1BA6|nr:hypothetical protein [Acuticoccus sediminis]